MTGTPRPDTVYTKRRRIAKLAKDCPDLSFTNLAHHIDIDWLHEAYVKTRKDGAVGVDGQTADEYEADLWGNLQRLLNRASPARTWHRQCGGCTFPRQARPTRPAHWEFPHLRIKSSSVRS